MEVAQDTGRHVRRPLGHRQRLSRPRIRDSGPIMFDFTVDNAGPDPAEDATFDSEFASGLILDSMAASNGGSCIATSSRCPVTSGRSTRAPRTRSTCRSASWRADFGADM